jgi:hypothetical protein
MESVADLKYEYEKALRFKENLEKNLERKKKLNLLTKIEEEGLREEIREAAYTADDLRSKYRRLESRMERAKIISESPSKAPWEE